MSTEHPETRTSIRGWGGERKNTYTGFGFQNSCRNQWSLQDGHIWMI